LTSPPDTGPVDEPERGRDGKRVAIVQSSYIPWKGYFDLINSVDEFVLLEDVQYTRRDWRNRNRIKTSSGTRWLTLPVESKGRFTQRIDETRIADPDWGERHWKVIEQSYRSAACFSSYGDLIRSIYESLPSESDLLTQINSRFLRRVCELLGITTPITRSTDYAPSGAKGDRLLSICHAVGADRYLSGPAARAYLDEDIFASQGVQVTYFDYDGYPTYPQVHPPFEHQVSALDLLFNVGVDSSRYMKSFLRSPAAIATADN
jgi:hypothetical protein